MMRPMKCPEPNNVLSLNKHPFFGTKFYIGTLVQKCPDSFKNPIKTGH